ncbi:MAG: CBS domain-containing protein [Holosporales bacterium]|jgi:CBS domain containing-hemolysin-like protein|nr:CBS domain-containing protein [Holosporales bacterium]
MKIKESIDRLLNCIIRLLSWRQKSREHSLRDAIEELIEEDNCSETQSIAWDEKEILGNVLSLKDIQVQSIMIPRVDIVSIQNTARIEELMSLFVERQRSSIVVYQGMIDNVVGVIYLKDVANWFYMNKPFNLSIFVKDVLFVPPTMQILDLLLKMRETGIKIAVVIDEYGGVDGLVSLKDLIEEIIGDIQDTEEMKLQRKKVIKTTEGVVIVDARSTFDEIQKYGGIEIIPEDNSIETIGGMISHITGTVPVKGELVNCNRQNLEFEILDADPRRVKSVKIRQKAL